MTMENVKKIGNTLLFAGVTSLAVLTTWKVYSLKESMKFYAKTLEEAKDLIKEADDNIAKILYPLYYGSKDSDKNTLLTEASRKLASATGKMKFVEECCASD